MKEKTLLAARWIVGGFFALIALVYGLDNPIASVAAIGLASLLLPPVEKYIIEKIKRSFKTVEKAILGFAFLFIFFSFSPDAKPQPSTSTQSSTENVETSPIPEAAQTSIPAVETFRVTKVIDGDTLEVLSTESAAFTIRLIGIDAPEKNACLYSESRQKLEDIISYQSVELIPDPTQSDQDKYQRLLRYVRLSSGTDLGEQLINEGLAAEYTYDKKYERQEYYQATENAAKAKQLGIWNSDNCSTPTPKPAVTSVAATPKPTPKPTILPMPRSTIAPTTQPTTTQTGYSCNCSKTCANLSCDEAQYQLNSCGCSARDRDNDGIACDSQCQ